MTLPEERTRAVVQTREFLRALCDSELTPGVPTTVRERARGLLHHYPEDHYLDAAAAAWPGHWGATTSEKRTVAPSYKDLMDMFRVMRAGARGPAASLASPTDGLLDADK